MSSFIHLHNHTHYSLLDGACRITDLVDTAKKYKMDSLAITDHGNMFGVIPFYKYALEKGIKPIIGMEAYIAPGSRLEKSRGPENKITAFHLVLLARNQTGYKNLMKLSSIGYLEGFYYKPRIDKENLEKYSEGLVVLSSCIKGEIPYKIIHDNYTGAKDAACFYKDLFGENFYLEIQNHGIPEEEKATKGIIQLSKELDISIVATNDTHYLKKEHTAAHDVLLCIQTNKDFDDPNRLKFSTDQIYFKSSNEMKIAFREIPQAIKTTLEIAEKCNILLDFNVTHLPHFNLQEDERCYSLDEYLEKKSMIGLKSRFQDITSDIQERLNYELSIIKRMGFAGYFLIVTDFIEYAKTEGIPVGPGRGSAAGSLVSYALGITDVDPLRYGLLFERFLNPERISMPDIDIDFCYENRDKIIDYVVKKYGQENVTQIITFGSMNARGVIRDVGRVLRIPYADVDQIAKKIPAQPGMNLKKAYKKVSEFHALCNKDETHKKLFESSLVLEGLSRHASTHAAGVVIAPSELTEFVPLFKSSQGDITTQYDMKSIATIGLLKMDFLGLRTLTVIDHTIKAVHGRGVEIDIRKIPLDDTETFNIFSNGETIGIFQFESLGMRDYLKKLQPECIEDLIAMNALYRPGPMKNIDDFIDRKKSKIKIEYLHPLLKPILSETHGIIVYQEQVMQIASKVVGFSLGKADLLRKAMGKKDTALMQEQKKEFIEESVRNKISSAIAESLFNLINQFAEYGFNKSHATCYSIVAYQTAFLKSHYPREFMAANLTSEMGNTDRVVTLINECSRMNIDVLPPDVNESEEHFTVIDKDIRFGLGAVKNVGKGAIQSIVEGRTTSGKFKTIYDFCEHLNLRLVNKKVIESLIQAGAMDSLNGSRAQKMAVFGRIMSLAQAAQQSANRGQTTIFEEGQGETKFYPDLPDIEPWSQTEKLKREKEFLGYYTSGHPLLKYEDEINAFSNPVLEHLSSVQPGQSVRLCGLITEIHTRLDRRNNIMAFFTMEDFSGSARIIAFSDVYEEYSQLIQEDEMVVVIGKADRNDKRDETSILASALLPLSESRKKYTKNVSISIQVSRIEHQHMKKINDLFQKHSGTCPIYLSISSDTNELLLRSNKYKVKPVPELIYGLRQVFGKENVWIEG